jgi:hypothetical protein
VRFRGADHFVGTIAGCPDCGRTLAACTARPCSPRREGRPVSRLQRLLHGTGRHQGGSGEGMP